MKQLVPADAAHLAVHALQVIVVAELLRLTMPQKLALAILATNAAAHLAIRAANAQPALAAAITDR